MTIRKAVLTDLLAVEAIYQDIHTAEEAGVLSVGWIRGVYPTLSTAQAALDRNDLFVAEEGDQIVGAGIINQIQVDVYADAPWAHAADARKVCVLHTLVISPHAAKKGYGTQFIRFYEEHARAHGWNELRIDTNARNTVARALYKRLGYREIAVVPTTFNGIPGVNLVLLEKHLD